MEVGDEDEDGGDDRLPLPLVQLVTSELGLLVLDDVGDDDADDLMFLGPGVTNDRSITPAAPIIPPVIPPVANREVDMIAPVVADLGSDSAASVVECPSSL